MSLRQMGLGEKLGGAGRDGIGRPNKKGGNTFSVHLWITSPNKPAQVEVEQLLHSDRRHRDPAQKVGAPLWFGVN